MLEIKIKMTKQMYKAWDSYNRFEKWKGRKLIEMIKANYGM